MSSKNKAALVIVVLHLVGTIGMLLPEWAPLMRQLTPLNLLIVAALVIIFQQNKTPSFYAYAFLCFLIAFFSEVVGVQTGWPFGSYEYGATLGPKLFGVPLLIGTNWLILVVCTASLTRSINNKWLASLAGALLMVGLDILLEPVAIMSDYWSWQGSGIPIQNYISWGALAFILHIVLHNFDFENKNELDKYVILSQASFFALVGYLG
ncbi:MAG: carotenoid biosynthesis protein [Imperialibacter sp.]|uniref:carotenoid biosynthesis protein n=1 Tax=Imperialibacter sp. TaxID=2038411 RepID=UPI0032EC693A